MSGRSDSPVDHALKPIELRTRHQPLHHVLHIAQPAMDGRHSVGTKARRRRRGGGGARRRRRRPSNGSRCDRAGGRLLCSRTPATSLCTQGRSMRQRWRTSPAGIVALREISCSSRSRARAPSLPRSMACRKMAACAEPRRERLASRKDGGEQPLIPRLQPAVGQGFARGPAAENGGRPPAPSTPAREAAQRALKRNRGGGWAAEERRAGVGRTRALLPPPPPPKQRSRAI